MRTLASLVFLIGAGCLEPALRGGDDVFEAEIGPEGGELTGGGMTLVVPPGALTTPETLSVTVSDEPAPDGGTGVSPVYRFEPEGLQFAERVALSVDIDEGMQGTLFWSLPGDPESFEAVGLAAGGLAEGSTLHFSTMFVGRGVCVLPTTVCNCRAADAQGDLVCPEDPSTGATCDIAAYSGSDGVPCSGYGPRPVIESWCDCYNDRVGYLCPEPYVFEPSQECPNERGLNGFEAAVGDACTGYDADNASYSGTILNCSTETVDTVFASVPGNLEGCYETSPSAASRVPADRCSTEALSWEQECLDVLDSYGPKRTTACPDLGDPAAAGSVIGGQLEAAWRDSGPARLSQLKVPYANKDDCKAGTPLGKRSYGNIDIAQVMQTGNTIRVWIAEVKPLTRTGLDLGWKEVQDCYIDAVNKAGEACSKDPSQRSAEEDQFCKDVGVTGKKTVKMDDQPGVIWDVKKAVAGLKVLTCTEGLVAYTCP